MSSLTRFGLKAVLFENHILFYIAARYYDYGDSTPNDDRAFNEAS